MSSGPSISPSSGLVYAAYSDTLRRTAFVPADPDKVITTVALGSSAASPNAEVPAITNAVLTPITAMVHDPADPAWTTVNYRLPADQGVGLVIREIGLLTADGTLVYRSVRTVPTEKTADMTFGDAIRFRV